MHARWLGPERLGVASLWVAVLLGGGVFACIPCLGLHDSLFTDQLEMKINVISMIGC